MSSNVISSSAASVLLRWLFRKVSWQGRNYVSSLQRTWRYQLPRDCFLGADGSKPKNVAGITGEKIHVPLELGIFPKLHNWPHLTWSKCFEEAEKTRKKHLHATKLDTWNHLSEGLYIPKTLQWNMHEIPKSSWKNCIYKCLLWILVNLPPSVAIILIVFLPCLFGTCQQLHCRIFQSPTVGDAAQDLP